MGNKGVERYAQYAPNLTVCRVMLLEQNDSPLPPPPP